MKLTVLIPTYRRPHDLIRCLNALNEQTRLADEIVVVVRDSDNETWNLLRTIDDEALALRIATISVPGVVAAMNAGLALVQGDVVAITDDDAAPHPDWLERIEGHFTNCPNVAGVGGRDRIHAGERILEGSRKVVGKVQWFGRMIGNHHLGTGSPREVDVLKGVNCAYRADLLKQIGFDTRLRGAGAQVHWEVGLGLSLRQQGWRLIYDPLLLVEHYLAQRFDEDQRDRFDPNALENAVHNETLVILDYLPPAQQAVFLIWALFVGTRAAPGLLQLLRFLPVQGVMAGRRLVASWQGRIEGWKTWRQQGSAHVMMRP